MIRKKSGDNPHVWYAPAAVGALAAALAAHLTKLDPAAGETYARRLAAFEASMQPLRDKTAALRTKYAGTPVTATEPLFDYMADALGLEDAQRPLPARSDERHRAQRGGDRRVREGPAHRTVKVLLYNTQTSQALAERMRAIANEVGVPVVAITETEPAGRRYQEWMGSQLDALERALAAR